MNHGPNPTGRKLALPQTLQRSQACLTLTPPTHLAQGRLFLGSWSFQPRQGSAYPGPSKMLCWKFPSFGSAAQHHPGREHWTSQQTRQRFTPSIWQAVHFIYGNEYINYPEVRIISADPKCVVDGFKGEPHLVWGVQGENQAFLCACVCTRVGSWLNKTRRNPSFGSSTNLKEPRVCWRINHFKLWDYGGNLPFISLAALIAARPSSCKSEPLWQVGTYLGRHFTTAETQQEKTIEWETWWCGADPLLPTTARFRVVSSQTPLGSSSFAPWRCEGK